MMRCIITMMWMFAADLVGDIERRLADVSACDLHQEDVEPIPEDPTLLSDAERTRIARAYFAALSHHNACVDAVLETWPERTQL